MEQRVLDEIILNLERQLLKPEIRQAPKKMAEILLDDCFEFCSSGYVWHFNRNIGLNQNGNASELSWEIVDFATRLLSTDVILATYKLIKHNEQNDKKYSLRSSIWKRFDDKWKMVHHNIYNKWAWTGGHADGDTDLLYVAIKEAKEETGVGDITPLKKSIASIDILPVYGHIKKGRYISTHLHLSIAYILTASEKETLIVKEDENSGVSWLTLDKFTENFFDKYDVYLYNKLIQRARQAKAY